MKNELTNKELDTKIKDLEKLLEKQKEDNVRLIEELNALRQIQAYYYSLMQNSEDYILICDSNGISQAFNAKYKQRGEELLNIEITPGIIPHQLSNDPEIIQYWDSLRKRVLDGEKFIAEYSDEKRGLYYETLFSPIREEGKVTGFIEVTRDTTGRKRVEKALQESDSFNSSLLEHSPTAILVYNPDTSVRYVNPFFEKLTGYCLEDVLGVKIPYPWSVEDEKYGSIEKRHSQGVKRSERKYRKKNGEQSWAEIDVTPIYKNGELVYSLGTWIDISERKNAEEEKDKLQKQLQQVHKMEAIGNLAGGVAHDYNNISSVIMGYAELALTEAKSHDPLHGYITHILEASKRATDITKQLLAFARKQPIDPKVLDLNDTINSMLSMVKRLIGEDISLAWMPGEDTWPVRMDPAQIDQILVNLCVNARDAIDNVGKITIETGNAVFDEDYCATHLGFKTGDYAMLAVSDDGIGMTHEQQEKIFEPFYTTKEFGKGTGLGLSTIYGIVKQNNGFINVYSEPGKGSTFKIYLPKEKTFQSAKPANKKAFSTFSGQGETIMVVEDDKAIRELIERVLTNLNYNVLCGSSPKDALRLAGNYLGKIDLLVTDIVMPEMNGRELSNELHKQYADLKVLYMSGYTANVIVHRGVLDENINYIAKPFSIDNLAAKVKEVLTAQL
ncbi:MAG: PAS domain S-box protein [Acidobacteria bacterium]|nr:PAS domain S-box protein [Acidobacteriota bacterium]